MSNKPLDQENREAGFLESEQSKSNAKAPQRSKEKKDEARRPKEWQCQKTKRSV